MTWRGTSKERFQSWTDSESNTDFDQARWGNIIGGEGEAAGGCLSLWIWRKAYVDPAEVRRQ